MLELPAGLQGVNFGPELLVPNFLVFDSLLALGQLGGVGSLAGRVIAGEHLAGQRLYNLGVSVSHGLRVGVLAGEHVIADGVVGIVKRH